MAVPEIPAVARFTLPAPAYTLWRRGELLQALGIRDDGKSRVEIIGGEIVVSPGPRFDHNGIVSDVQRAFFRREMSVQDYPWRTVTTGDFDLKHIGEAYIPDVIVLGIEEFTALRTAHAQTATAAQIAMVVEITSTTTAAADRRPGSRRRKSTKWSGYAHEGVEFYLLVDRDPRVLSTVLYTEPDLAAGTYGREQTWRFGETVALPEPFEVEIATDDWEPWE